MKSKRIILPTVFIAIGMVIGGVAGFLIGLNIFAKASRFSQRSQLAQLEESAFDAYRSSDSALGEKELLRLANDLQHLVETGLETDIPGKSDLHQDLVLAYGRLGMLCETDGSQARSRKYYELALQQWKSMNRGGGDGEKTVEKLKMLVAAFDAIEEKNQPRDGTNGSPPIRAETNHTSSAAGSRRSP